MKIATIILFLFPQIIFSQNSHALYAKANPVFLPVAVLNAGFEYQLNKKTTIEADGFISPWKSAFGEHAQIYMAHLEARHYFDEAFKRWYFGANAGFGVFDITKWDHWNQDQFERGFNFMLGIVVGYQFQWKKNWNIDLFLRGGNSQSFYHGYEKDDNPPRIFRYENAEKWNKSGEWLPYGGGIMICYKLK